jgi:flagellar motor protein MotB
MSEFEDNEYILFSKVKEYNQPSKNLIGIPRQKQTYDLKSYDIIPIPKWITKNRISLQELFDKIIDDNLLIFSTKDVLKRTLSYFYLKEYGEEVKDQVKKFLKTETISPDIQEKADKSELEKDLEKYHKLEQIKQKFISIPSLVSSEITYDKIRFLMEVRWRERKIKEEDIEEFFENITCTKDLTLVTAEETKMRPIWTKYYLDLEAQNINREEIIRKILLVRHRIFKDYRKRFREDEKIEGTLVYFILSNNSFGLLNLNKSVLLIETYYGSNVLDIIERNAQLRIVKDSITILNISGSFNIYNVEIYPELFLDMILNDEFLRLHIVFDEFNMPTYKKKKTFYHFKLPLVNEKNIDYSEEEDEFTYSFEKTILFFVSQEYMPAISVYNNKRELVNLKQAYRKDQIPYLRVHFFRSLSESFVSQFYHKLNRLFQYYNIHVERYIEEYKKILDDEDMKYVTTSRKGKVISIRNLNILQNYEPDLFIRKYARKCQKSRQPQIIDDISKYKGQQILGYPLVDGKPKWFFICNSKKYKYPGLKENTLENKDKFRYLPCCFESDQRDNISEGDAVLIDEEGNVIVGRLMKESASQIEPELKQEYEQESQVSEQESQEYEQESQVSEQESQEYEQESQLSEQESQEYEPDSEELPIQRTRQKIRSTRKTKKEEVRKETKELTQETSQEISQEITQELTQEISQELTQEQIKQELNDILKLHKIKTDKVIPPFRLADINFEVIEYIFQDLEVYRFGVPLGPNSILHALCIALIDKDYYNSDNRENYVIRLRKVISNYIHPEVCKQELYEYTVDEIRKMITTYEIFDTKYFIRAIEEYFKINLLILTYYPTHMYDKDKLSNHLVTLTTSASTRLFSFELPRHSLFYVRRFVSDRKTVVIFKHIGTEADGLKFPHTEIVVHVAKNENNIKELRTFFDPDRGDKPIIRRLYNIFFSNFNVFRWNRENYTMYPPRSFEEIFDRIRPMINYQVIDKIGKSRAFILKNGITLIFPPTSTENKPSTKNVLRASLMEVLSFIDENEDIFTIVGYSISEPEENNIVDGLWIEEAYNGIYIPIEKVNVTELPEHIRNLGEVRVRTIFRETEDTITLKFEKYKRIVTAFLQVCVHKMRLKDITKVVVDKNLSIESFEESLLKIYPKIKKRKIDVNGVLSILTEDGLLVKQELRVPDQKIKKSIEYAYSVYDKTSTRARIKEEKRQQYLTSSWDLYPYDLSKNYMTRWLDLPNKDINTRSVIKQFKVQYENIIYSVVNKALFRKISLAVVSIGNEMFIAYNPFYGYDESQRAREISIVVSKFWEQERKIFVYSEALESYISNNENIIDDIIEADGLKVYEVLDSGEISLKEEIKNDAGQSKIAIMSVQLNFIEYGIPVKGEYYFSLLSVTPKKKIEERVFKIP